MVREGGSPLIEPLVTMLAPLVTIGVTIDTVRKSLFRQRNDAGDEGDDQSAPVSGGPSRHSTASGVVAGPGWFASPIHRYRHVQSRDLKHRRRRFTHLPEQQQFHLPYPLLTLDRQRRDRVISEPSRLATRRPIESGRPGRVLREDADNDAE
jgi:hypothetical protein